jgi:hypothetical protein
MTVGAEDRRFYDTKQLSGDELAIAEAQWGKPSWGNATGTQTRRNRMDCPSHHKRRGDLFSMDLFETLEEKRNFRPPKVLVSFEGLRYQHEQLRHAVLLWMGQDFQSEATGWEKKYSPLLNNNRAFSLKAPVPIINGDGELFAYLVTCDSRHIWLWALQVFRGTEGIIQDRDKRLEVWNGLVSYFSFHTGDTANGVGYENFKEYWRMRGSLKEYYTVITDTQGNILAFLDEEFQEEAPVEPTVIQADFFLYLPSTVKGILTLAAATVRSTTKAAAGLTGRLFAKTTITGTTAYPAGEGFTTKFGDVVYSTLGSADDVALVKYHESVHSFFSPKLKVLRNLRADFGYAAYNKSSLVKYLEEALAETYAQLKVHGFKGLPTGIAFPVKHGYVTLKATVIEGAVATITVGGTTYGVYHAAQK